jgi:Zn finger protein HypA/HybF involved in hydrogenase expression
MKYLQKSFNVYANYETKKHCEGCGEESPVYYQTIEGRFCPQCRQERNSAKKERDRKR